MIDVPNLLYYNIVKLKNSIFVVGSIALDSLETPNGNSENLIFVALEIALLIAASGGTIDVSPTPLTP